MSSNSAASLQELHRARVEARNRSRSGDLTVDISLSRNGNVVATNAAKLSGDPVVKWTPNMIRFYSFEFTDRIIKSQLALKNPPQQILFDESPVLNPLLQRRSIDVIFDIGTNVREVMDALIAEARKRVPGVSWGWKSIAGPISNPTELAAQVHSNGPVRMNFGDRIYLVPVQVSMASGIDPTYANIQYLSGAGRDNMNRKRRASKRRGVGFYGLTTRSVRRKAKGAGVHVKAVHSFKHAGPFRKLPPGVNIGQRGPGVSKRTGKKTFYQGSWAFSLTLMRGARAINRRG